MKITLNLASQPYVDVRSIIKQLRILMAVFLVLALPLWLLLRGERKKAEASVVRVQTVENNVQRLEQQQQSYQALMREPKNAAVLTQSDFLNSLFRRKAFSWTATMTDLETVMPSGVQVLSIEPEVSADGEVAIRLRVSGARDRSVELVRNLEKSRHFAYPRLAGEALATSTGGPNQGAQPVSASIQVNFDILADYRPLSAEEEKSEKAAEEKADKGIGETSSERESGEGDAAEKKPQVRAPRPANVPNARSAGPTTKAPATTTAPGRRGAQ
jgi:type IV pilus assembly protein PilN